MPENPLSDVVQKLQAEVRERRVEAERFRLEAEELRSTAGKPDPRLARLQAEVQRLRDELLAGVRSALEKLEKG